MCSSCNAAKPKSAGMKMLNDITGKEICGLTVLERVARAGVTNAVYRCRCKCGKELTTSGSLLLRRKSVGCRSCFSKGSGANGWSGCGQFPGKFFTRIQNNARKRNIEYSLTKEYICDLYKQQNGKCSLSGVELRVCSSLSKGVFTASLDRIDSSRGYVKGNVQFVHARINVMKMELPQDEFIEWAKLVAKHNGGV